MPEAERWIQRAETAMREARTLAEEGLPAGSISRSYYAMLYAARAALVTQGVSPKSHGGILQKFGELFVKPGLLPPDLTASMAAALELREQADYEVDASALDREKAEHSLDAARTFVERVRAFLGFE